LKAGRVFPLAFFLSVLTFFCLSRSDAQVNPSKSQLQSTARSEGSTVTSNMPPEGLIHLDVAVRDGRGKFVSGLTENDFTLLDNGAPQKIVTFRSPDRTLNGPTDENERLTEAILVLDRVDLSPVQFTAVKNKTIEFLRQNGGQLSVPVSVYLFTAGELHASANPTTDGNALAEQVAHNRLPRLLWDTSRVSREGVPQAQLRSAQWDSALRTVYSIAVERRDKPGRKALVWMGYGWLASGMREPAKTAIDSLAELSTRIREARVAVCQIPIWPDPQEFSFDYTRYLAGVRSPSEFKASDGPSPYFALPVLAMQSGGTIQSSSQDIVRDIGSCIQESSLFYGLSFDPAHATKPDEYHDLKVQTGTPGWTAQTGTGYYNQPVFYDQPRIPSRRVSTRELEALLATDGGDHDSAMAEQLDSLELTERLSSSKLEEWKSRLHGNKSKEALAALADASVFLAPRAEDILPDPPPSHEELVQMLSKTVTYLDQTLTQLPDLSATRIMVEYKQRSPGVGDNWKTALADQSLHVEATERATLQYRNGHEVRDALKKKGGGGAKGKDLDFIGVFGPILHSVVNDATRSNGKLTWSRWEQGEQGREAVIAYEVPNKNSTYDVVHCCVRGGKYFKVSPEYHGEIAIAPATGAILRLTMISTPGWILEPNLHPVLPVETTGLMVEYGPVSIGGREAICPRRSVVFTRTRTVRQWILWDDPFEVYAPYQTQLNDIAYKDYRKFGSESRILLGFEAVPDAASSGGSKNPPTPQTPPNP
jgi:VWFA-related protein